MINSNDRCALLDFDLSPAQPAQPALTCPNKACWFYNSNRYASNVLDTEPKYSYIPSNFDSPILLRIVAGSSLCDPTRVQVTSLSKERCTFSLNIQPI